MPYPMIHMQIAWRAAFLSGGIRRPGDFILGSVAPDAVHFHDGFCREMKETTHLWKGCGPFWGATTDPERWKRNIERFRQDVIRSGGCESPDFAAGYLAHLLSDYLYDVRIYTPLRKRLESSGDSAAFMEYRAEARSFDQWLHQNSPDRERIWELLSAGRPCGIRGLILKEDVERQQNSLLQEQFVHSGDYEISGNLYCTREKMEAFVEECVRLIVDNSRKK